MNQVTQKRFLNKTGHSKNTLHTDKTLHVDNQSILHVILSSRYLKYYPKPQLKAIFNFVNAQQFILEPRILLGFLMPAALDRIYRIIQNFSWDDISFTDREMHERRLGLRAWVDDRPEANGT